MSEHVLEVGTKRGPQRFVDKPPHDEGEMSGRHWRYCGYDANAKAHLILMADQSIYSGTLLLQETGQHVHAGHTVHFSPTLGQFLAVEQEAGTDGERWTVRDLDGKSHWKGYAGTMAKIDGVEMVVSTFAEPKWNKRGELTARVSCAGSPVGGTITLLQSPSWRWGWSGHAQCR